MHRRKTSEEEEARPGRARGDGGEQGRRRGRGDGGEQGVLPATKGDVQLCALSKKLRARRDGGRGVVLGTRNITVVCVGLPPLRPILLVH